MEGGQRDHTDGTCVVLGGTGMGVANKPYRNPIVYANAVRLPMLKGLCTLTLSDYC